jgi:hypothetical protein
MAIRPFVGHFSLWALSLLLVGHLIFSAFDFILSLAQQHDIMFLKKRFGGHLEFAILY